MCFINVRKYPLKKSIHCQPAMKNEDLTPLHDLFAWSPPPPLFAVRIIITFRFSYSYSYDFKWYTNTSTSCSINFCQCFDSSPFKGGYFPATVLSLFLFISPSTFCTYLLHNQMCYEVQFRNFNRTFHVLLVVWF